MLEQIAYESPRVSEERQVVYVVSDLERLSAVSLGYGTGGSSGSSSGSGGGFGAFSGFNGKAPSGGKPLPSLTNFVNEARTKAPSSGLSRPSLIGTYSDFKPASDFGLKTGIAEWAEEFLARYRAPGAGDKEDAGHINLEYFSPINILGQNRRKKPLINLHMDIDIKEE